MPQSNEQLVIVGTGPAGHTAALYSARAGLSPLVIDGIQPGGQLTTTTDVENYPGFPEGIQGPDLMVLFRQQAERFGARYQTGTVTRVDFSAHPLRLWVDDRSELAAQAVIIATGASAKYLGLKSEAELLGYGVSACATCDGFFYRDKEVVVVGGGDTAMEEATFLTRFATKVTVIHRRGEFRASKIMQERALRSEKIHVIWNANVIEVVGDREQGGVTGVVVEDVKSGEKKQIACSGMFVAIGHKPNTDPFVDAVTMDDKGYIAIDPGSSRTNIAGVFAAGDVADQVYRQAVTAAGTGCMAALDAERWLAEHN